MDNIIEAHPCIKLRQGGASSLSLCVYASSGLIKCSVSTNCQPLNRSDIAAVVCLDFLWWGGTDFNTHIQYTSIHIYSYCIVYKIWSPGGVI